MTEERKALERLIAFAVGTGVAALIVFCVVPVVWTYLSPFIVALAIAALLQPATRFIEKRLHLRHTAAVTIPVVVVILLLMVFVFWFLSYGIGQAIGLLNNIGPLVSEGTTRLRSGISRLLAALDSLPPEDVQWIQTTANNAISWATEQVTTGAGWLLSQLLSMAGGIPYALIYANFLFLAMFFVSRDYDGIRSRLPGGRARVHREAKATTELTHSAISGLMGFLQVQAIYALEVLVVSLVFWQILGYQYAAVAAIVAGVLEFIPLFGCGVLYIVWFVIALLVGDPSSAFSALGLYLGLLLIRRLTEPKLLSNSTGISPFLSLVGMFAGMRAGGIVGLIGGPVVMTVLVAAFNKHYLSFVPRDIRILANYLKRRWDVSSSSPLEPDMTQPPAPEPPPAPEKKRRLRHRA